MAPPSKAAPITDHDVREAVLFFFDLARRWLRAKPSERTEKMTRLLAVIVAAARRESVDRDMEFVVRLTEDVHDFYAAVRGSDPPSEAERLQRLTHLLDAHYLPANGPFLDALDANAEEIRALKGPADAARTNVGVALGLSATTVRNYADKLDEAQSRLAGHAHAEAELYPVPAAALFNWRQTLRAARAIRSLLEHELGFPPSDVQRFMTALVRSRRGPRPL